MASSMNLALTFNGCHRRGGVERSVWELARHLADRHEVHVYAYEFDAEGLDGVTRVQLATPHASPFAPLELRGALRRALAGTAHDHVISFGSDGYGADVQWVNSIHAAWMKRSLAFPQNSGLTRFPHLRYMHPRHLTLLGLEHSYFRRTSTQAVVAVSQAVSDDLTRLFRISPEKIHIVHNGFSQEEFSSQRRRHLRAAARSEFGYSDEDIVMLMAANELGRKGFGTVLDALALVRDPRLHLLLVGRASITPEYQKQILHQGLDARVRYAGSQSDMGRTHAASDLFVLPTQYEAFCLAIIEALASGLPVITTDVPGANDRVTNGENGLLLTDPLSATELASKLSEALSPSRREEWSKNAVSSVADLTWEALAVRTEELLLSLPGLRR